MISYAHKNLIRYLLPAKAMAQTNNTRAKHSTFDNPVLFQTHTLLYEHQPFTWMLTDCSETIKKCWNPVLGSITSARWSCWSSQYFVRKPTSFGFAKVGDVFFLDKMVSVQKHKQECCFRWVFLTEMFYITWRLSQTGRKNDLTADHGINTVFVKAEWSTLL